MSTDNIQDILEHTKDILSSITTRSKTMDKIKQLRKVLKILRNNSNTDELKNLLQLTEQEYNKTINIRNTFRFISRNDVETIKNINNINFKQLDEDGNTLLHHCIKIGDIEILTELLKKGGKIDSINGEGHTLLEYACLIQDPNIINFLLLLGADIKKHIFFRKGNYNKYLFKEDIDLAIILKILILNSIYQNNYKKFIFLENYFNINQFIGLEKYTIKNIFLGLEKMFENKITYETYKNIIIEEIEDFELNVKNNIKNCYEDKVDILLVNLIPFINYPFNLSSSFMLHNEIKFKINSIIKDNKKNYKNLILNYIFKNYIENNLFKEDYIGIIVYRIMEKNKI
jgi:ankyrin repeat protein